MRLICSSLLVTILVMSGQQQSPARSLQAKSSQQARLEQQLRDADLEFCRQTAARRLDGWMDSFADDASILQNGKTVSGKADLRKHYEPMFANKDFTLSWTPTHAEASKDGSLGYTYGTYEARTGSDVSRGMYLTILAPCERQMEGSHGYRQRAAAAAAVTIEAPAWIAAKS